MGRILQAVWRMPTGTEEEWNTTTMPIDNGHMIYAKDTNQIRIGNGKDLYPNLKPLERIPVISLIASTGPEGACGTELHPLRFTGHGAFLSRFETLSMDKYTITDYDSYTGYGFLTGRKLIVICDDQVSYDKVTEIGHVACTSRDASEVIRELLIRQVDGLVIGTHAIYNMFMDYASQIYHGIYDYKYAANLLDERFVIPDTFTLRREDQYVYQKDYTFRYYSRK